MKRFVLYRRVSSEEQGDSGLGLEAQLPIIKHFTKDGVILHDFTEVQSAKDMNRPILKKAIEAVKLNDAILVVSKTDRLSRDVKDALTIIDDIGEKNLLCCDLPETSRLILTIFFALAEHERMLISLRTKLALDAKKERQERGEDENAPSGRKYGFKESDETKEKRRRTWMRKRGRVNDLVAHIIKEGEKEELSNSAIARKLNEAGCTAPRGGKFQSAQVQRIRQRMKPIVENHVDGKGETK